MALSLPFLSGEVMTKKKDVKADEIKDLKETIKQREAYIVSLQKKIVELEETISDMKNRIDVPYWPTYHERIPGR